MFTRDELIKMLENSGVEYTMDSDTPGIQYSDGRFETYAEVQTPREYFEELEREDFSFTISSKVIKKEDNSRNYHPYLAIDKVINQRKISDYKMELSA